MSLRELIYDILHANKPAPSKPPDWIATADMTFQDNTWFLRDLEEQGKDSHFPENRKDYVLDANDNDGDGTIFRVGIEIMEELCRGKTVLTAFKAYGSPSKKKQSISSRSFPERYHQFLQQAHPTVSAYAKSKQELSILSEGFNHDAYSARKEMRGQSSWFVESVVFYIFSATNAPSSAEQAQKIAELHQADLGMHFHEWPDELHFDFDPQKVDVNEIWAVVKAVCTKHGLVVTRDPDDPNIN